jgi:hypothetical protein
MEIQKVIEMGKADLETLLHSCNYYSKLVAEAQKYERTNEVRIMSSLMDQSWARYQQLSSFLIKIEDESEKINA